MHLLPSPLLAALLAVVLASSPLSVSAQLCGGDAFTKAVAAGNVFNVDNPCGNTGCCSKTLGWCSTAPDACDPDNDCASGNCDPKIASIAWGKKCAAPPTVDNQTRTDALANFAAVSGSVSAWASVSVTTSGTNATESFNAAVAKLPPLKCDFKVKLDACTLSAFMGGPAACPYCPKYVDMLNTVLSISGMDCPSRVAMFLAHARYSTQSLNQSWTNIDFGTGSMHLSTSTYPAMLKALPVFQAGARDYMYPALLEPGNPPSIKVIDYGKVGGALTNDTALRNALTSLARNTDVFWSSGAWWFIYGAASMGMPGCGDLRTDSDTGVGQPGSGFPSTGASGFFKVSNCMFPTGATTSIGQRFQYYLDAVPIAAQLKPATNLTTYDGVNKPKTTGVASGSSMRVSSPSMLLISLLGLSFLLL